ncbi:MAG: SUMF1/EgtB/PvdO family nonheme iron enzyme [Kiritimatiellaeota bacterium]|nr:SUMF1/EgtB/PvdO family nonheme iron enzyme [Kiritimatiellota bacterium]
MRRVVSLVLLACLARVGRGEGVVDASRIAADAQWVNPAAVERAIAFLEKEHPGRYDAKAARAALAAFRADEAFARSIGPESAPGDIAKAQALVAGVHAALLANPLLDADRIVYVRRVLGKDARKDEKAWGAIARSSCTHTTIRRDKWTTEIVELRGLRGARQERVVRRFDGPLVRDLKLTYDAKTVYYTSVDANKRLAVYALPLSGEGDPAVISPTGYPDVDWFDAVMLPDGRYAMLSTAAYQGLPCQSGLYPMAQLYQVDPAAPSNAVRQLTFEQDSDYTPTVLNDGRVMFTRWEYSDTPHYFTRILMTMNPDGTSQLALWGSGSYYPTVLLQARAIPGETSKVIGTVTGHHNITEVGRLIIIDPSLARKVPFKPILNSKAWGPEDTFLRIATERMPPEQTGLVQEIPGFGEWVETDMCDEQVANQHERGNRPYFAYPHPLSANFHLVTARPKGGLWGIYLVDTFDNITLLHELADSALLEPALVEARPVPRVIPDRITPGAKTASVHIADIYKGPGLQGVPRGTVKSLRVFSYHFNYMKTGGHESVGVQSGWDIKRILGTVGIEEDGSACFEIPANTTIAVQPLDASGAAVQLMRSWFVGMPGERVSCTGCHEDNRMSVPVGNAIADKKPPQQITPWHGPPRAMTFTLEVWPQVQKYCAGCHGDKHPLRKMTNPRQAYESIHPYLRRPGPESELPMYPAMDWHVSSSLLFQMLRKGHHNVTPDAEFYERLAAWTDLNCPWRGKWDPPEWEKQDQRARRIELSKAFAAIPLDAEAEYDAATALLGNKPVEFIMPGVEGERPREPDALMNVNDFTPATKVIDLGNGEKMTFVRVPSGAFTMGNAAGYPDERPRGVVTIERPFWMAATELRNRDYALFDPEHDSRYISEHAKDHVTPGYIGNHPDQPVVRVSWARAAAFCEWFAKAYNVKAALPTEAQWEWAARAGTATQFFYGGRDTDFGPFANLADKALQNSYNVYTGSSRVHSRRPYKAEMGFPLYDARFADNWFVTDYVAQVKPNAWGLYDMVGNVNEWTRSDYLPYPYTGAANTLRPDTQKVARGGSWATRPKDAGAAVRYAYETWHGVHDVGFRLIIED